MHILTKALCALGSHDKVHLTHEQCARDRLITVFEWPWYCRRCGIESRRWIRPPAPPQPTARPTAKAPATQPGALESEGVNG